MKEKWEQYIENFYISNFGNLKNINTGKLRKFSIDKNGYYRVGVKTESGKTVMIYPHRAVAQRFIPKVENKNLVNHIDGNKLNNLATNLEWCTAKENTQHAFQHNLCNNSYKRKLTEKENHDIINIYKEKKQSMQQLAENYKVSKTTIFNIIHNQGYNG